MNIKIVFDNDELKLAKKFLYRNKRFKKFYLGHWKKVFCNGPQSPDIYIQFPSVRTYEILRVLAKGQWYGSCQICGRISARKSLQHHMCPTCFDQQLDAYYHVDAYEN